MAGTFEIKGLDRALSQMTAVAQGMAAKFAAAAKAELEIEMTEAKRRTPVDTGNLRASGTVTEQWSGREYTITLSFGGPAAPYALQVHENLEAFHKSGQAKFLESVLLESAPYLAKRIALRMKGGD